MSSTHSGLSSRPSRPMIRGAVAEQFVRPRRRKHEHFRARQIVFPAVVQVPDHLGDFVAEDRVLAITCEEARDVDAD